MSGEYPSGGGGGGGGGSNSGSGGSGGYGYTGSGGYQQSTPHYPAHHHHQREDSNGSGSGVPVAGSSQQYISGSSSQSPPRWSSSSPFVAQPQTQSPSVYGQPSALPYQQHQQHHHHYHQQSLPQPHGQQLQSQQQYSSAPSQLPGGTPPYQNPQAPPPPGGFYQSTGYSIPPQSAFVIPPGGSVVLQPPIRQPTSYLPGSGTLPPGAVLPPTTSRGPIAIPPRNVTRVIPPRVATGAPDGTSMVRTPSNSSGMGPRPSNPSSLGYIYHTTPGLNRNGTNASKVSDSGSSLPYPPPHALSDDTAMNRSSSKGSSLSGVPLVSPTTTSNSSQPSVPIPQAPVIPERRAKRKTVDELLDLGAALFSPPHSDFHAAFVKWDMANSQAELEKDYFSQARALSNMGCAYRALSKFENALNYLKKSWAASLAYCKEQEYLLQTGAMSPNATQESSHWYGIVSRTLDLDNPDLYTAELGDPIDILTSSFDASSISEKYARRSHSVKSSASNSSAQSGLSTNEPFCGPPIVIWFMNLTTNLGNAYFSLGKFEHAVNWHAKCLLLAETVLEENPLPPEFDNSANEAGRMGNRPNAAPSRSNQKIKLSFLHQSTIMAQSRSLTHIGVCCQFLGLDDSALQCHSHASSILGFYAERSPSFVASGGNAPPSPRSTVTSHNSGSDNAKGKSRDGDENTVTSSTPNPRAWQNTQLDCVQATISANLAASYHAKGRLPAAIERLERAAKQFKSANDVLGSARVRASLGAMKIEVGRVLGSLHWIRNMEVQAVGAGEVNECMRYWGPPRLKGVNLSSGEWDEAANISVGSPWVCDGIQVILDELRIMKEKEDLFGVLTSLLNIASGYTVQKHPYMALHAIGQLLPEQQKSLTNIYMAARESRSIPQFLHLHACYTICQAVFLLTRLQRSPEQVLYPGPIPDDTDGFPFFNPIPINSVLSELGMGFVSIDLPELDSLIAGYLSSQDTVNRTRMEVQSSLSYSVLYSYIGGSAVAETPAAPRGGSSSQPNATLGRDVSTALGNTAAQAAMMGVGTGMDSMRQKTALISAMGGKADWMLAARYDIVFNERPAREYYIQGTLKLDRAAKETVKALTAGSTSGPPLSPIGGSSSSLVPGTGTLAADLAGTGRTSTDPALTSADSGLVSAFFSLTGAAFAVPPVNPSAPPTYHHALPCFSPVVTPALRATSFASPALFALAADTMAFAAFQLQARAGAVGAATGYGGSTSAAAVAAAAAASGLDLLSILRIPMHPGPAKVHRELLSAAASMYCALLGWCETCMRDCLREPDSGVDIVFIGRDNTVGLSTEPRNKDGPEIVASSSASTHSGDTIKTNKFPCEHYYWRG
ncbi:hypothetical protein DFJ73DRAFT_97380 [Zopfochytrium polystomum]|nr:hypothetical protein DFJ73DRAFT_97380 [Zopfochytrium polystomum]